MARVQCFPGFLRLGRSGAMQRDVLGSLRRLKNESRLAAGLSPVCRGPKDHINIRIPI